MRRATCASRKSGSRRATCSGSSPGRRSRSSSAARGWTARGASSASSTTLRSPWPDRCCATVWYQVQEVLWVEHITDLDGMREELGVYNALVPAPSELSSTLLIAIDDERRVREELQRLVGIDGYVRLEVGSDARVAGVFEAGRQTDEKVSSVQ